MLRSQKGQALLIVVLIIVIVLTVVLAIVSRSIINLKTSQDQADSQKALAAAEAGIQRVLADPTIGSGQISESFTNTDNKIEATYKTTVTQGGGTSLFLLNGTFSGVDRNNYVYIWPSKVSVSETNLYGGAAWNGSTNIYWGTDTTDSCKNAALEVSVISGKYPLDTTSLVLTKYAFDPCAGRAAGNGFNLISQLAPAGQKTVNNKTLLYMANIPASVSQAIYLIAITPLYVDNTYIAAQADPAHPLPLQGKNAFSTGDVGGQVVRQAAAFKNLPQIPAELFPYTIFSP